MGNTSSTKKTAEAHHYLDKHRFQLIKVTALYPSKQNVLMILAHFLIKLFNSPNANPNNAQLIFTTHDTNQLDSELLHRDQIWFL